jgi:hypothetical protein
VKPSAATVPALFEATLQRRVELAQLELLAFGSTLRARATPRAGAGALDLKRAAQGLGRPLPPSLRTFLLVSDGARLPGELVPLYASTAEMAAGACQRYHETLTHRSPKEKIPGLPIAWDPGSLAVLTLDPKMSADGESPVHYWHGGFGDHERHRSFAHWLAACERELRALRDERADDVGLAAADRKQLFEQLRRTGETRRRDLAALSPQDVVDEGEDRLLDQGKPRLAHQV